MRPPAAGACARRTTLIPIHTGELARWLMKKIIKDAGLSEDDIRDLL